eukprot:s2042_g18.t1
MQKPRERHAHRKVKGTTPVDSSVDERSKRADANSWWPAGFWKGPASSLVLGLAVCWMTWTSLGLDGQSRARSQEADGNDVVKVLDTAEDAHGHLVAAVSNEELGVNFLTFGSSIIGAQYVQAEYKDQAAFTGFAVQESILFVNRSLRHVLQLGLGAGVVASYLRSHRIQVDVVELSDAVLYLAEKRFEFNSCCQEGQAALGACDPGGPSATACRARQGSSKLSEARSFLFDQEATRYDVVISDVFNGSNPGHMHSVEVFARLKDHWLIPGGILVLNFVGFHRGPGSQLSFDVATTLRAVFQVARCYRDQGLEEEPDMAANLVCFASDEDFRFNVPQSGDFSNPIPLSSFWVMQEFQAWEVLKPLSRTAGHIIQDSDNELLHAGAQSQIERQLRAHARNLIPEHVWKALGIVT